MDYTNLDSKEIQEIIKRLKYPKKLVSFNKIKTTISSLFGTIDIDELVIDEDDIQYIFHIFRGKRNPN